MPPRFSIFAVTCHTTFLPFRDFPHTWQKPRKVNEAPSVPGWLVASGRLLRKSTRRVGMERELVPSKTLGQYIQNPLGILEVRERHYGVVGETDKGTFPLEPRFHLVLEPLVQHVVQENVR